MIYISEIRNAPYVFPRQRALYNVSQSAAVTTIVQPKRRKENVMEKRRKSKLYSEVSREEIENIKSYLGEYLLTKQMIAVSRYERQFAEAGDDYGGDASADSPGGDEALWRAKMIEIRRFIMNLSADKKRLVLYYHFIRNQPIEKCAEYLGVSRATVFRIYNAALCCAAYEKKQGLHSRYRSR